MVDVWSIPRAFAGRTIAVCASGPSMSAAVAEQLRAADVPVIAVNSTFRLVPWAWAIYGADSDWWLHESNAEVFGLPSHKVTLTYEATRPLLKRGVLGLRRDNSERYSDEPDCLATLGNSGAQAIQLAVKTGAARVLLVGFDFHAREGHHWHGDHPAPLRKTDPDLFAAWARRLERVAPDLLARSQVVNCTRGSGITCFPFSALDDALCSAPR
jgi:hypothetical protein